MSGPTIVTHDNLVDIWNVKIGQNDLYGPRYDVAGSLAEDLETKIVKTILGEGDTAATSITDFKTDHATGLAVSTNTHKLGGAAVPANGMLEGVQVTQQFKYRNAVLVADYLDNADANATNEAARGTVAIKPSAALTTTQTKILPDSSAFENATVRLTVTDPYEVSGASFQDASGIFTGEFNRSTTDQIAKYRYTRNVNANCANDAGSASITVAEHTAWNTANWGTGGTFVNGYVTLDASSGIPNATLYGDLSANNILSSSFNSTGENANEKGFDISYNYVVGQEPIVGRYSLSWAGGTAGDNVNPITIETNSMTDLVVVADKNDYTTFLSDTTTPVTLAQLPTELTAGSVVGYLTENDSASLNPGFNFIVTANAGVTGEVLVTTTDGISSPIAIDASGMSFSLKNKYYLEQSVPSTVLLTDSSANLLNTTTVEGGVVDGEQVPDVTVTNSLTITNGSLTLTGTDAAQFEIVDGTESLGAADYNTNGDINIAVSVPESSYRVDDSTKPRSFGGPVDVLKNFASTCFVHYLTSEDGYIADVDVLATADKSIDISYNITTLASQTTVPPGPAQLANAFGNVDGAAAFILNSGGGDNENSAISPGDIAFSNNENTYTDGELTVVDLKCQKKWSDNGIRDDTNALITGAAVDVVASNMSAVGVADIADLRIQAEAKAYGGLSSNMLTSFGNAGWSLSHKNGDSKLKSSLTNQGVISDANIITILGGSATTVHDITLNFAPAFAEVDASKFTKFHNTLDITYGGETQTTYDDEFEYLLNERVVNTEEALTQGDYAGIPDGKTLVKRSYTESVRVKTAFRFGNYSNLDLTTGLFNQTTTYYVLKDGSRDLPRQFLNGITLDGSALKASITSMSGGAAATPLVAKFVRDDLKPYVAKMLKVTAGGVVQDTSADLDVWYNTPTTITQPNVGTFTLNITLSPTVSVMAYETFTVDLTLANGSDTFEFAGKKFSAAEVDALTTKDPYSINLATATGTTLSGTTQYTRGAEGAIHTLTGGGYTFNVANNIYVDIRVYACPNGLFKVVKNGGAPTYKSISNLSSTPYLKLDSGVRVQGALDTADYGYQATWTLTNDAIFVKHWANQDVEAVYNRIPSLNYVYRPATGWKGVSNKWLRGFNINHYVTIVRTPSTFVFDIAGYTYSDDLYAGLSYQHADVGNLRLSTSGDAKTMFAEAFDEPKPFPVRIKYGSYRIRDITGTDIQPIDTPIVPAYKTVISFRKGVRIISKSLSTKASAEYSILYSLSDTLNVRRLADYTSTSTTLSQFTAEGEAAGAFTMTALKTGASNLIGNVLNIRYLGNGDIPNLTCFLTIAPAFLKFQAVDHTTTGAQAITSIPFTKHADQLLTQYKAVSHSAYEEGVAVSQSWNPFAGSDVNIINVNDMTISAIAKTFEQYRTSAGATHALNVDPHKLTIEYASGFGDEVGVGANNVLDFSDAVFDDIIPLTDFTNSKVKLESDFDGEGTLKISLHQKNITTNGAMPTVIFDEADRYNLVIELGSHLLTPIEGAFTTDLEFSAGDCTGLTTYCIDSIYTTATDFKVKIARYSNASGVNSDLFNASISGGIAVGGSVKETIELSTPLTEEPGDLLTVSDLLTNIKDNMVSVARNGWTTVTDYNANSKVVWLKPTSAGGKTDLRTALLLSKYVPRSVTIFELDDAHRLMDNQGVAVLRVASQGKVYRNTTSATSDVGALLHLANALAL